jgi:hypothetical protein
MTSEQIAATLWIMSVMAGGFTTFVIGICLGESMLQQKAVELGFAHFDPKTREFTWGPLP